MIGLVAALAIGTSAVAADDLPRTLTLDRVFGSPDLSGSQPRAMKLSPDG
jgi:dipeptidyl-peptidase-4